MVCDLAVTRILQVVLEPAGLDAAGEERENRTLSGLEQVEAFQRRLLALPLHRWRERELQPSEGLYYIDTPQAREKLRKQVVRLGVQAMDQLVRTGEVRIILRNEYGLYAAFSEKGLSFQPESEEERELTERCFGDKEFLFHPARKDPLFFFPAPGRKENMAAIRVAVSLERVGEEARLFLRLAANALGQALTALEER